jgi:hypothetical protein
LASAAACGATERAIMQQTRHRSVEMVRRYIREGEPFHKGNAARFTGLSARSGRPNLAAPARDGRTT